MDIDINSLFTNLINKSYRLNSIKESVLVATRKLFKAKYSSCSRTSYKKEICYKLYSKQRLNASPIMDVLFIVYSDILYSVLLTNLYNIFITAYSDFLYSILSIILLTNSYILITAHSDFLYSILPIASLTNSYILIIAYSDFLYSVLPIILFTNPYSILPIAAYSKSIDKSALSTKYLSSN